MRNSISIKNYWLLFLLFGFCTVVQAQRSDHDEEYSKVDNSRIEVFYNYTAIDTVLNATQDHRCVLQIGDNSSLFRSYSSYHRDSMMIQLMDSVDHQRRFYLVCSSQFEKRISSNYFRHPFTNGQDLNSLFLLAP